MFFLVKLVLKVERNFDMIDHYVLYRQENNSELINLKKRSTKVFTNSNLVSLKIFDEKFFIDEKGFMLSGIKLNSVNSNFQYSLFLANDLLFLRGIGGTKKRGILKMYSSELLLESSYFSPREKNIILNHRENNIIVCADRKDEKGRYVYLHVFVIYNNNKCTEPKYSFNFDFPDHAAYGKTPNERTFIKKNLGIINNKLYLSFTDNSLMIIDIDKGEVLQHLGYSDGGKIKRDPINHLVSGDFLGGGFVDANKGYLFNLYNAVLYYFDANTEEIEQVDLSHELEGKNLDGAIIKYYDDDIFAILDLRSGGVGIIDRYTHKLIWDQTMYHEGKKVRPLELKISGNYMCITDSAEQLHIFERTTVTQKSHIT